jgi:hypothetical protein
MSSSLLHQKAATAVLILGGLFVGACGAQAADAAPTASTTERSAHAQAESCANCAGGMGNRHAEMQSALAQALGMTVEELRAEMDAGKRPPQIAQERGVDFAKVREAMRPHHGMRGNGPGGAGRGPGAMDGRGGPGHMMGHAGDCPMMQAQAAEPPAGADQK